MNILYIMNVDWNWIKQRPHFISEGLSNDNCVTVLFQKRYTRKGYQNRKFDYKTVIPMYVIPRGDRNKYLCRVNNFIKSCYVRFFVKKKKIECIYITFPDQIELIDKIDKYEGMVIYDCMDNHAAFIVDKDKKKQLINQEKRLIEKADFVLCSSKKLENVLCERYGDANNEKITIVRNGYNSTINDYVERDSSVRKDKFVLAYFGTISSWFDFNILLESIKDFPNIEYWLFGPVVGTSIPCNRQIVYKGTVEHSELQSVIQDADVLIMPFIVNDIIESVDPVKLYEYINFNKNIITVYYDEIQRFSPFVHFYTDYNSFKKQIEYLFGKKVTYSNKDRRKFLEQNNWNARTRQITHLLEGTTDNAVENTSK